MQNSVLSRLIWRVRIDGVDGFAGIERCAFRPAAHCVHYYITQGFRACCQAVAEKTLFLVFRSGFCVIPHSLLSHRPSTLICISKKKQKKNRKRLQGKHTQSHTLWCCVTSDHAGRGVIRSGRWAVKCLPPFFLPWLNWASNQGSEHLHRRPLMLKCDLISHFEAHLAADVNDSRLAGAFSVIPAFHLGWKWAGWWVWRRSTGPVPLLQYTKSHIKAHNLCHLSCLLLQLYHIVTIGNLPKQSRARVYSQPGAVSQSADCNKKARIMNHLSGSVPLNWETAAAQTKNIC